MSKEIDWSKSEDHHTHYIQALETSSPKYTGFHVLREGERGLGYYDDLTSITCYHADMFPHSNYILTERTYTNEVNKDFALELANLLEKHKMALTSKGIKGTEFSYVGFQTRDSSTSIFDKMRRSHVTPYDLRCETGMSCKEANDLYHVNKTEVTKETQPWGNEEIPPIGYNFKFEHEFEEGFEHLGQEGIGWEDGDELEVVYHIGDKIIVLNKQEDVLSTTAFNVHDLTVFKPLSEVRLTEIAIFEVLVSHYVDNSYDVQAATNALVKAGYRLKDTK